MINGYKSRESAIHNFKYDIQGTYLLEYKAIDGSNNIATKQYQINVVNNIDFSYF